MMTDTSKVKCNQISVMYFMYYSLCYIDFAKKKKKRRKKKKAAKAHCGS